MSTIWADTLDMMRKWQLGREDPMPTAPKFAAASWDEIVEAFLGSRAVDGCSDYTLRFYRACLGPLLGWSKSQGISPDQFGPAQLTAFLASLQLQGRRPGFCHKRAGGRLKQSTLDTYRRTIRACLNHAAQTGGIEVAYVFPKPKAKRQRHQIPYLSDDQLETLSEACENARDRALFWFLIESGLRRREASEITWGNISWDGEIGTVYVEDSKTGEAGESYFTRKTWDLLCDYWPGPRPARGKVWVSFETPSAPAGRPLKPNGIRLIFRRLAQKTGIHVYPHLLRHMSAKRLLEAGAPVPAVREHMRHRSASITADLYGRFIPKQAKDAYRKALG